MKRVVSLIMTAVMTLVMIAGCASEATGSEISELLWSFTDREIGMNIEDSKSGYILVSVQDRNNFDTGDIIFISDDESVVTIECTRTALSVYLYFEIKAMGVGTTYVYAMSADSETVSEKIKITVVGDAATEASVATDISTSPQTSAGTARSETEPSQTDAPAADSPEADQPETDPLPQLTIDSVTGEHHDGYTYVLNTSTKKIHKMSCASVKQIKPENYATTTDYEGAIADGYVQCKKCG